MNDFEIRIDKILPFYEKINFPYASVDLTINEKLENYANNVSISIFVDIDNSTTFSQIEKMALKNAHEFLSRCAEKIHV